MLREQETGSGSIDRENPFRSSSSSDAHDTTATTTKTAKTDVAAAASTNWTSSHKTTGFSHVTSSASSTDAEDVFAQDLSGLLRKKKPTDGGAVAGVDKAASDTTQKARPKTMDFLSSSLLKTNKADPSIPVKRFQTPLPFKRYDASTQPVKKIDTSELVKPLSPRQPITERVTSDVNKTAEPIETAVDIERRKAEAAKRVFGVQEPDLIRTVETAPQVK